MILGIIKSLLGFKGIADKIADAYVQKTNATTERERIAADERIKELEAKRDVLVTESGSSRVNLYMRVLLALPTAIILWKVLVYDKALGQWTSGRTDALSDELWQVVSVQIAFYFVYEAARLFRRR